MENIDSLKKEIQSLRAEIERLKSDKRLVALANQHQAAYQQSQVRFRTVFENSRLGNKIITSDLKILQVNNALVAMLGYDQKEEVIGTRIMDYVRLLRQISHHCCVLTVRDEKRFHGLIR